jgi:hypothetical protein
MQNTAPSDEGLQEIVKVVQAVMLRPGETLSGALVYVLVDGPNGDMGRWVVSPADAHEAVLRLLRKEINRVLED